MWLVATNLGLLGATWGPRWGQAPQRPCSRPSSCPKNTRASVASATSRRAAAAAALPLRCRCVRCSLLRLLFLEMNPDQARPPDAELPFSQRLHHLDVHEWGTPSFSNRLNNRLSNRLSNRSIMYRGTEEDPLEDSSRGSRWPPPSWHGGTCAHTGAHGARVGAHVGARVPIKVPMGHVWGHVCPGLETMREGRPSVYGLPTV